MTTEKFFILIPTYETKKRESFWLRNARSDPVLLDPRRDGPTLRLAVDDVVNVGVGVGIGIGVGVVVVVIVVVIVIVVITVVVVVVLVGRSVVVVDPAPAPAATPASSSSDLSNADGDDDGMGGSVSASGRSDSSRIVHVTGTRTPWMGYLRGGSWSDHRQAVAEEKGEREGGCSGSAVGIDRAFSHVSSSSREGRRGGAGGGGGGVSTSSDASGRVRAVTSTIKIRLTLDNTLVYECHLYFGHKSVFNIYPRCRNTKKPWFKPISDLEFFV
jgi:hypothetical protein